MSEKVPRTIEIAKGSEYTYPAVPCQKHGGRTAPGGLQHGAMTTAWCPVCERLHPIEAGVTISSGLPSSSCLTGAGGGGGAYAAPIGAKQGPTGGYESVERHFVDASLIPVWQAIEMALLEHGDTDVSAGLAWLTDQQCEDVAKRAVEAVESRRTK